MTRTRTRKRSGALKLTLMAGAAGLSLGGCSDPNAGSDWNDSSIGRGPPVEVRGYRDLEECRQEGRLSADECQAAYRAALDDDAGHAPRYDRQDTCEIEHGAGGCEARALPGGGSVFVPLLAGFVVGRLMNTAGQPYYRGTSLYRQRDHDDPGGGSGGGGYRTAWGGRPFRDYRSGSVILGREALDPPAALRQAPPKVMTRAAVVSRGGFGRSFGARGGRGGFGG